MNIKILRQFNAERWFYLFLAIHLITWTVVPAVVRHNLPLDAIEGTIWGHQLEWGYDKNPFLNGWLTALAGWLGGSSGWMTYLFSQLSVAACFWVIWQFGKKMLTPAYALVSVMLLEGVQYYHIHAIDFNDNTLELGTWALTTYFFYNALRTSSRWSWILTGLFAGLGMMAKYYTIALLAPLFLFLFDDANQNKPFSSLFFYLGLLTFLAVILPHFIWLFYHDFITVTYVFERAGNIPLWTNHFLFPAQFAWEQTQAFLPALVLFGILFIGRRPYFNAEKIQLSPFDRHFLLYAGLGPFVLTLVLSLFLGITLRAGWGMPLLSFWGLMLVALTQPAITKVKLKRFIAAVFILMALVQTIYSVSLIRSTSESSANFPGRDIAAVITQIWHEQYHTKLEYVAGSRWVGGNIEFYSPDHPAVFIEWSKQRAPWIHINDMQQKGAVFIWEISENESLPPEVQAAYPRLQKPTVITFFWDRNVHHLPPIKLGMALLPPKKHTQKSLIQSKP